MSNLYYIVETDNFGGDYPDESFVNLPPTPYAQAEKLVALINDIFCSRPDDRRYWKIVREDYKLAPGFEP